MSGIETEKKTGYWTRLTTKIIEINDKYKTPKIHMSPAVKFTLLMLRIYLLFLVSLLIYKFITTVT